VAAVLLAPLLLACGGGSNLPSAPGCVDPTPTVTAASRRDEVFTYANALREGVERLEALTDDFGLRWPGRRFSRAPEFRQEFVAYAGESACLAKHLIAFDPPGGEALIRLDEEFEAALEQYLAVLERGRTAVQKRNVSQYRDFRREIDSAHRQLEERLVALRAVV